VSDRYRPDFITKARDPPKLHLEDKVQATILDIVYEKGEYKGESREQYRFDCTLNNYDDYPCRAWIPFYDPPGEKSHLGMLIMNLGNKLETKFLTVEDARRALLNHRQINLRVNAFSEPEEEGDTIYPRFKVVYGHVPDAPKVQHKVAEFAGAPPKPEEPIAPKKGSELFEAILELKPELAPDALNALIRAEIEASEGMFDYKAATFMVSSSLGVPATARPTKATVATEPPATQETAKLSEETITWINYYKSEIGGILDYQIYNQIKPEIRKELSDHGLLGIKDQYPILKESARAYVAK